MNPVKLFAIGLLGWYISLASPVTAKDRLIYYSAGVLTLSENAYVRQIDHSSNRQYIIKLGFINFSDSTITLNYREGGSDFKTVTLEAHDQYCDLITMNALQSGSFSFDIRANFGNSKFNFVSYDLLLLEED